MNIEYKSQKHEIYIIAQLSIKSMIDKMRERGGGRVNLILPHPNFAFFGCLNDVKWGKFQQFLSQSLNVPDN